MADQRTMAQLLQAPTVGYEDAIVGPTITAHNFELKHGLLTLVQNNQFFGHDKEDPHAHVRYFNKITSTLKFPNVPNTSIKLMLFPFCLEGAARIWLAKEPPRSIFTWDDLVSKFINQFFPPSKTTNIYQDSLNSAAGCNYLDKMPRECLAIIESMSKVRYSRNKPVVDKVSTNTSTFGISPDVAKLKDMVKALLLDKKTITTRSGMSYDGPQIPPSLSFLPKVVEDEPEATKDIVNLTNNGSTEDIQPQVVPSESPILTSEPVTSLISEPVIAPVSAPKPNPKSSIPYPPRRNNERNHEKANKQIEKFYQIFKDMSFNISFADALILMPEFASTLKALIGNKEKLREPGKFLIPCDFLGMAECLALADLGASINLMPFFVWKRLSLPDLTPTYMTLELADHLISRPVGVAEDVYVKVGSFYFSADFVVVDFDADPRVPLILGRSFLKTRRALIDVFEGELILRVSKEAITFNLDQTFRYSANYSHMTAKRIDVIDMACEEYFQEVLGFSDLISSGNPTPYYDPIVSTTSSTLTPFGNNDFLLEEVDAFLAIEDDPTSPEVDQSYLNLKGDIFFLEAFLNDDPSSPPPNQGNYLPKVRKELNICEAKSDKSSIDEPLEVELKDLPPYIEYAFLEGDDKFPVIIAKDLSVEEKTALITVIKLLEAGLIYPISDSPWVSPVHCVPKKGGFTVVENEDNELILTRLVTCWCVCIDYRKLNEATHKDHFPLPFMDQMLERLAGN
nr:reverse transcriptase domain-containing protein [Tanacetum cinerariifolium]